MLRASSPPVKISNVALVVPAFCCHGDEPSDEPTVSKLQSLKILILRNDQYTSAASAETRRPCACLTEQANREAGPIVKLENAGDRRPSGRGA
jgi:hypothetical protein